MVFLPHYFIAFTYLLLIYREMFVEYSSTFTDILDIVFYGLY